MNNAFKRLYPEISAGGYDRDDQKIMFFHRLHALISEDMVVADFGAGRGLITEAAVRALHLDVAVLVSRT